MKDIDAKDKNGDAALHRAAGEGRAKQTAALLKKGANPGLFGRYGDTPLHRAAYYGHRETAAELIKAGADPNIKTARGNTALRLAIYAQNAAIAADLARAGAIDEGPDEPDRETRELPPEAAYWLSGGEGETESPPQKLSAPRKTKKTPPEKSARKTRRRPRTNEIRRLTPKNYPRPFVGISGKEDIGLPQRKNGSYSVVIVTDALKRAVNKFGTDAVVEDLTRGLQNPQNWKKGAKGFKIFSSSGKGAYIIDEAPEGGRLIINDIRGGRCLAANKKARKNRGD